MTQAFLARSGQARDKGRSLDQIEQDFRSEVSDVLAHLLLIAKHFDIDLVAEIETKWMVWHPSRFMGT